MSSTRSAGLGPDARPVAVPEDIDGVAVEKALGIVELPLRVRWSGPPKTYDLRRREDRVRLYEQVLREGNDEDVRRYIDIEELARRWNELVLPTSAGPGPRGSASTAEPTLRAEPSTATGCRPAPASCRRPPILPSPAEPL